MDIEIVQSDITRLKVDAIVNAANKAMCGGGGVDGAIHRAAGHELLEECRTLNGCDTGFAKLTKGYALPAKYVIHAVGPVWYGGFKNEATLLSSCYAESIKIANNYQLKTIAFPAISCGAYRFPIPEACEIAINTVMKATQNTTLEKVIFSCFDQQIERSLQQSLASYRSKGEENSESSI